jgi:hypothetical protein
MPRVKPRFRGSDPHPPCTECRGTGYTLDDTVCEVCGGIGELGYNEPTQKERKEGMRADTLDLLIRAEDLALLGSRVVDALDEENSYLVDEETGEVTRDEAATINAIRKRFGDDATG